MNTETTGAPAAPSTRQRRLIKLAVAGLLAAGVAVVPSMAVGGTTPPFTIDGVVPDGGAEVLQDPAGNTKELGPVNSNTTKIGVIHNAATPMLAHTNPNAQVDLRRAWLDSAADADDDIWIYFAWERDKNTGSGFIAYEFMADSEPEACDYAASDDALIAGCNPWANRQAGDFMILWDQQGGSKDLYLRTWSGTAPNLTLSAPMLLDASVSAAEYSADGFRGEAALNVTDAIFGGEHRCLTFANVIPSTVTGNSDTADYKDTILQESLPLTNCEASIGTDPRNGDESDMAGNTVSIGPGYVAVKDQAVVDITGGTATPAGSVTFFLCQQPTGTCATGGTEVGSTSIAGGTYPKTVYSPTAYVTAAGRYCWRGEYSGDPDNDIAPVSESAANECFEVTPVTPTISTSAGPNVVLGNNVTDQAQLSGTTKQPTDPVIQLTQDAADDGSAAGGSLTFTLYKVDANGCVGDAVHTSDPVAVSGDGPYSPAGFAPTEVGKYQWVASYSGSSPNTNGATHNTACDTEAEEVEVTSVPSSLTSAQKWIPRDTVTVTAPAGSGNLAGTVHFALYASNDCSGTAIFTDSKAVAGPATGVPVTSDNGPVQDATGSFSWKVSYDSTNPAQRDIGDSCHETSALTIANGGTVSSP